MSKKLFLSYNNYKGEDGGYLAIYTREKEGSVYGVGDGIYVKGQIRVKGEYNGRIFIPEGCKPGDNITQDPSLLAVAKELFPDFQQEMWLGGDTGGWFGIQG